MDDIVYRPRYSRQLPGQVKRKARRNKRDKDGFAQKLLTKIMRQTLISIVVFILIFSIAKIGTPQTLFLQNRIKVALSHNIDFKKTFCDIQSGLNTLANGKKLSEEANLTKDESSGSDKSVLDASTLTGVGNQEKSHEELEPVSAVYTEEGSLVESMEYEDINNEQVVDENDADTESVESEKIFGNTGYSFIIPVGGIIGSFYGERVHPIKKTILFHKGIDIEAQSGTPIKAAYEGEVVEADMEETYGNYVKIKHNDGLTTLYCHCSKLLVNKGKKVNKGDVIAEVGSTGSADGPHLHFEVRRDNSPVNPLDYIVLTDKE